MSAPSSAQYIAAIRECIRRKLSDSQIVVALVEMGFPRKNRETIRRMRVRLGIANVHRGRVARKKAEIEAPEVGFNRPIDYAGLDASFRSRLRKYHPEREMVS